MARGRQESESQTSVPVMVGLAVWCGGCGRCSPREATKLSAMSDRSMTAARRPEEGDREVAGAKRQEPIRVLIADDHALFRRGLEMVLERGGRHRPGRAGERRDRGGGRGRRIAARRRAHGHPDAEEQRHRGVPRHQGGRAQREDRHADDQRRGRGPVRGDPGGRQRLPAQGHPARRGGRRGPRGARRPVPDQPVDGGQAAHRVRDAGQARHRGEEAPAGRPRPSSPTARWRCSSWSPGA